MGIHQIFRLHVIVLLIGVGKEKDLKLWCITSQSYFGWKVMEFW